MHLANVYLATKDLKGVEKFALCGGDSGGREELITILENPLLTNHYRNANPKKNAITVPLPDIDAGGNIIVNGEVIGHTQTVFLRPLPIEPRLRVAYVIMYEEFVKYLLKQGFPMLAFDGQQLTIFVPNNQLFKQEAVWESFIEHSLGKNVESIQRNYYALATLHQLGMGPPSQPIFSKNHALLLVAFCCTAWKISKLRKEIEERLKGLGLLGEVQRLDQLFKGKPRAAGQYGFFQKADEVGKYILDQVLPKLTKEAGYETVPLPFLEESGYLGLGTDFAVGLGELNRFCYGCGRTLTENESFTSSKLVYESSKQRPQSGFREMQEKIYVCHLCFFAHLFSPLYPEAENVLVEVRPHGETFDILPETIRVESALRGAVLNEVGLVSGRFFELREATSGIKASVGSLPYLYYKLSRVSFSPGFVRNNRFVILGGGDTELLPQLVLFLRSFKKLNLFTQNTSDRKAYEMALKSAISDPPQPFTSLYHYAFTQSKRNESGWRSELDGIHRSIIQELGGEKMIEKIQDLVGGEKMSKKQEFERIIGVAKIFDAFVSEVVKNGSKADFQKLVQSIDGVEILSEFGYRFAEVADRQYPFVDNQREPTAYECAKKVLAEVGVAVEEKTTEYGRSVQLNSDALKAVMLKVLEWSNDNAQDYQRFMNKVKYDVLARYPEKLKTRRGER